MMDRLEAVCDMAQKHNLRLIVTILVGWMSGISFRPSFMGSRNPFTDPTILRYQVMLCRHLAARFQNNSAIVAWDLGNEQNCFDVVPSIDAAWHWTYLISSTLRRHDPNHAVFSGMSSLGTTRRASHSGKSERFLIKDVAEHCDILTVHPYPEFLPLALDPPLDPRGTLAASWQLRLYQGVSGIPVMCEEFSTFGDGGMSPAISAAYCRRVLYSLLGNGSVGALWWCHTDFTCVDQLPYRATLMEQDGLGLFDASGIAKPVAQVFAEFSQVLSTIDTGSLERIPPQAAIVLPETEEHHEVTFNAFVLAKRAGFDIDIVSANDSLDSYRLLIVPSVEWSPLTHPQWEKVKQRVSDGAALYVSTNGAQLPGMYAMAGCELQYKRGVKGEREARFCLANEVFKEGYVLRWNGEAKKSALVRVTTGTLIAKNSEGDPLLVEGSASGGTVVLATEPIEHYLCEKPGISPTDCTYKIYQYLAVCAGIDVPLRVDHPNVECSLLRENGRLIAVLTNHSSVEVYVPCQAHPPDMMWSTIKGDALSGVTGSFSVKIAANDGLILQTK
jgi:beta-galactosidase